MKYFCKNYPLLQCKCDSEALNHQKIFACTISSSLHSFQELTGIQNFFYQINKKSFRLGIIQGRLCRTATKNVNVINGLSKPCIISLPQHFFQPLVNSYNAFNPLLILPIAILKQKGIERDELKCLFLFQLPNKPSRLISFHITLD